MRAVLVHAIIAVLFISIPCRGAEEKCLSLATLNWAPYVGEDLQGYGFTTEMVTRVFAHSGYRASVTFMPWARVLRHVVRGPGPSS